VFAGAAEVAAPSLVAVAGGGAAEVEPVTVVTSGAVSVKEMDSSCSEEEEELVEETALETELVMEMAEELPEEMVAETEPKTLLRELAAANEDELAAAAEEVLARLALTMLEDKDVATGSGVLVWPTHCGGAS
jgi:glycerol-3-phosphate dehydrogenase